MFADNTLTPKEAIRLCALGTLAQANEPLRYAQLAAEIRHFTSRITGPSLDIMGTSIELLKYEGLIEAVDGVGMEDDAALVLTDQGRSALNILMTSRIRAQGSDVNKLITTLKLRFLHMLSRPEQAHQIDLHTSHENDEGHLSDWLKHDIAQLENHLNWLENLRERVGAKS
jgi:hypothetical protein